MRFSPHVLHVAPRSTPVSNQKEHPKLRVVALPYLKDAPHVYVYPPAYSVFVLK